MSDACGVTNTFLHVHTYNMIRREDDIDNLAEYILRVLLWFSTQNTLRERAVWVAFDFVFV
jgi:hypothetical protein